MSRFRPRVYLDKSVGTGPQCVNERGKGDPHRMRGNDDAEPEILHAVHTAIGDLVQLQQLVASADMNTKSQLEATVAGLNIVGDLLGAIDPVAGLNDFRDFMSSDPHPAQLKSLAEQQRREVNFFEVLGVHDSEAVHSNVLAWLLNPQANHGAGSHFLENFLDRTVEAANDLGIPSADPTKIRSIDWSETEVRREWQYIDILILNRKAGFVCAVENKIRADEGFSDAGVSQLTGYRETLKREFPGFAKHRVFLSPSGVASRSDVECRFWVPADYAAIRELVVGTMENYGHDASKEGRPFLSQYEAVLRRNIVPDKNDITRIAQEIYLEHRDAIELIYRNKPNYRAGVKQALKEAIAEREGWQLEREDADYVRFRISGWDRFEAHNTGTGFEPQSKALLVFTFYCPYEPTNTGGPALALGPGTDETVRNKLFECARQNPKVFQPREHSLQDGWTHLHEYRWNLLEDSDLGTKWADGSTGVKLTAWVEEFADRHLPAMEELIARCLNEFGRRPT